MACELRQVPLNWQHPRTQQVDEATGTIRTGFQPMFDQTYQQAMSEYNQEKAHWESCTPAMRWQIFRDRGAQTFEELDWISVPDPAYYRPDWPDGTVMGVQLYETVTEGQPISPVFESVDALGDWLLEQGADEGQVERLKRFGSLPTAFMMITDTWRKQHTD